jgi:hypothetical protein
MKTIIAAAVVALGVSACGTHQFQKQGSSVAQIQRDEQECRYEAVKNNPTNNLDRELTMLHSCMRLRGYR